MGLEPEVSYMSAPRAQPAREVREISTRRRCPTTRGVARAVDARAPAASPATGPRRVPPPETIKPPRGLPGPGRPPASVSQKPPATAPRAPCARAPAASEGAPKLPERVSRSISRAAGQRTTMQGEILNEEAGIEKGENARMASFVGAIAIADLVKQVYIKSLTMRSSDYVGQRLALKAQHTLLNVRS